MKKLLEELWNEHFAEKCALINNEEEKALVKKTAEIHKALNEILTNEQKEITEKYVEALYESQSCFVKKAFFKGCEFATSFLLGAGIFAEDE